MRRALPLLLVACGYDAPVDDGALLPRNVLSGELVVPDVDVVGPGVVLLTPGGDPPPPDGTGRPLTFGIVPPSRFTQVPAGIRAAEWALTDVRDGTYYLTGLIDQDRNFHPEIDVLAGASCGDLGGRHVDGIDTQAIAPVEVSGAIWASGLTVAAIQAFDTPRPAFTVPEGATFGAAPVRFDSVAIDADFGEGLSVRIPGPRGTGGAGDNPCASAFTFVRSDADGDGIVDRNPNNPLLEDRFPRVILQWLGLPLDTDGDGVVDDYDRGLAGDDVLIASVGDPAPTDGTETAPNEPYVTTGLTVAFSGVGRQIAPDGTETLLSGDELPGGAWSITLIAQSGQTWTVPNELAPDTRRSRDLPPPGLTRGGRPDQGRYLLRE